MSKFKVGDRVRRMGSEWEDMNVGDEGVIESLSRDGSSLRIEGSRCVGFNSNHFELVTPAPVEKPPTAQIDRAITDRALVSCGGKVGKMSPRNVAGQLVVLWDGGGYALFADADFGTKIHPCDASYLGPVEPTGGDLHLSNPKPTDPRDAEIARLKSELERATTHFFDPTVGARGDWLPFEDYRFETKAECDKLRAVAEDLGLVERNERLVPSLTANLPKRIAATLNPANANTLGDALGRAKALSADLARKERIIGVLRDDVASKDREIAALKLAVREALEAMNKLILVLARIALVVIGITAVRIVGNAIGADSSWLITGGIIWGGLIEAVLGLAKR